MFFKQYYFDCQTVKMTSTKLFTTVTLSLCLFTIVTEAAISQHRNGRIAGGQAAADGDFPFLASLRNQWRFHYCGASILSERWLLTAAHCTFEIEPNDTYVGLGSASLSESKLLGVAEFRTHPDYVRSKRSNDVALVRTISEIIFDEFTKPAALINRIVDPQEVVVAGWGRVVAGGDLPDVLQYVKATLIEREVCQEKIKDLTEDLMCTTGKLLFIAIDFFLQVTPFVQTSFTDDSKVENLDAIRRSLIVPLFTQILLEVHALATAVDP